MFTNFIIFKVHLRLQLHIHPDQAAHQLTHNRQAHSSIWQALRMAIQEGSEVSSDSSQTMKRKYEKTAQDKVNNELALVNAEIDILVKRRNTNPSDELQQQLTEQMKRKETLKKDLKRLQSSQAASQRQREKIKEKLVKCYNPECCSKARSDYFQHFPQRFFPAPRLMKYDDGNLMADDSNASDKGSRFLNLFQTIHEEAITRQRQNVTPYDQHCSYISSDTIKKRSCPECNIYFGSEAMMKEHRKSHVVGPRQGVRKRKPKKVVSKRANEVLIENGQDETEWVSIDDFEEGTLNMDTIRLRNDDPDIFPNIDMQAYHSNPWEFDDGK